MTEPFFQRNRLRSKDGTWLNTKCYPGDPGAPKVVLAHGWTCNTDFWLPVVERLVPEHCVITYDQRGHGRSDVPVHRGRYATAALADDLEAVVAGLLQDGEQAVLVGHSMGGMTIMAAGGRSQIARRTAAVLLCSTGPADLVAQARVAPPKLPQGVRDFLTRRILKSRLPLGPITPAGRAVLKSTVMGRQATREQVQACAEIVHACPTAARAHWGRVLCELDVRAGLTMLEAPASIVVGTADKLTPPPHAHAIRRALRNCAGLTELPGVGHMAPLEDPDAVAAEIRRLVTSYLTTERTEAA
ncbi:alpha/beta hydrolase [Streptomyces tateyamensis]|uniref:Alpha/beta hydrolase n=1 Tax=Streptomyces tateyamensis TaxID=565073 RepID=A0A2V4NBN2_9ACTN|nr:alpha/beta hydrolase [Streptomyces tateyamensis]PYC80886.1 alpha/beta hydrolase [Streptomyces tateyamensis]